MLTSSLWSEGPPVAWTYNFHQIHHVIKDDGSFQPLFDFPDLNPNSDMASCDLINMSPIYLFFDKGLLARTLQAYRLQILHVQGRNFNYRLITLFILKPWSGFKSRCLHILKHQYLEHEIFCFAKLKSLRCYDETVLQGKPSGGCNLSNH